MKFQVVEQKTKNLEEIYPIFKKEYMNPYQTVSDIKTKMKLSNSEYKHLRKKLHEETGVEVKPNTYNKSGHYNYPRKYIHERDGVYEIKKDRTYYGRYETLEEAQEIRDKLVQNKWNKKMIW